MTLPASDIVTEAVEHDGTPTADSAGRTRWSGCAAAAWLLLAAVTWRWPDIGEHPATFLFATITATIGIGLGVSALLGQWLKLAWVREMGPWLAALPTVFAAWELSSAKLSLLPRPFFAAPQDLLEVLADDWARLAESTAHSALLLATGYTIGAMIGFMAGVTMGWSRIAGYWLHPILRFIGPLPATAWLPIAFFVLPTSWTAGVFLIALATGFPVTVLTWSGVAGVSGAYYDVARTHGAGPAFMIFRVAIPAAMPSVFVGLFMGLGGAFAVLVVAEMMGVKAGLGWYLTWAQGWAAYPNMYAALIVMALMCSGLITLLFRLRDCLLGWQKGLVRW